MLGVGDVVGSYTVLAHLRSGGMADLFLARRDGAAGFRRHVAIKVVHPRHAQDEQLVRMFLDEALISARVDHPNVVHVEDLGQLRETYFLVMEYVHGCSLAQLMRVLGEMRRRLSPLVAVAIAARVAEGLHAAHETTDDDGRLVGLVHRDVSPQNILLSHKGHVKLIDFGVAKARLRSEETNVATLKGKVRYMPPEQATTGIVDRRSDVYSLGIVLWEMLTMRRLFAGKSEFEVLLKVRDPKVPPPSRFVPDVPRELDEVVLAALARDPDARPQNAKLFRRMLARALPESMSLDSAHLADLLLSVLGRELAHLRHDLPEEVSRVLQAEQIRVAGLEREERGIPEAPLSESAVEVMTVHSEVASFVEDELDGTPEVSSSQREPERTKPGKPVAIARSTEADALRPDGAADEEGDPTEVADAKEVLAAIAASSVDDEAETPRAPLRRADLPISAPSLPRVAQPAPRARWPQLAPYAIALAASIVVGIVIAFGWSEMHRASAESAAPATLAARTNVADPPLALIVDGGSVRAPVSEPALDAGAPEEASFDAGSGALDAGTPRQRRARRRRWQRHR